VPGEGSWSEVRSWFPALRRWTYLNAASMSPLPEPVHRAMAAAFLGCRREELAFTASTSEGVLRAGEVPDWREGDNVVMPLGSFPSVVYPLLSLREQGVEVRYAGSPGGDWVSEEEVLATVDERTRLVSVSWVSFATGHRYDLERLGEGRTRHLGWTSAVREGLDDLTDYTLPLWPTARRFESGSVPPLLVTPSRREARAGITTFEIPDSGPVVATLRRAGVIVAAREGRVRVSTHFYNDENDLNRLFEALPPPDGPP